MKAIVLTKYGTADGLHLREVDRPTPKGNEVLIRVCAATVTAGDCEIRSLKFELWLRIPIRIWFGIRNPRNIILGQEVAGEIEAVGHDVTKFRKGDAVFGSTGLRLGGHAEYVCVPEKDILAIKPANMTYEEAAGIPVGGLEAQHFMRKGNVHSGQKVLINGAGGSIGTLAVQLAKLLGAEVTAVDHTEKLDMLHSLGADQVIDYTREDFTEGGQTYDVIFDVVGKSSFSGSVKSLKPNGRYLLGNPRLSQMLRARWTSLPNGKKVMFGPASPTAGDLIFLKELIEAGKLKAVIDRRYPLEQTAEAHRYVETGRKKGNVVITVEHHNTL